MVLEEGGKFPTVSNSFSNKATPTSTKPRLPMVLLLWAKAFKHIESLGAKSIQTTTETKPLKLSFIL